ncbi:MAG: PduL/EutD family phosphate acyltransferase [Bacteroidales bacterium]|nr:PduL/EutD family phosphate acyltransferase [Bacteroidales bacterium]
MNFDTRVEVSARHIHLSLEHLEKLFGKNYKLNKSKDLFQTDSFATEERVICEFVNGHRLERVRIIVPVREQTQLEISKTDAYNLGVNPPVRCSGDLAGSEKCRLIGPNGHLDLKEGVIIAQRHLHINEVTARKYKIKEGQVLSLKINSEEKLETIYKVLARISLNSFLVCHLDVDGGNAAGIAKIGTGEIFV